MEDLKASTKRETQRVRNVKRKMELAEQKTERLQNVSFSGGDSQYDDNLAISARQSFIDNEGWTIVDGGQV